MSSRSLFTVIAMAISTVYFMPEYAQATCVADLHSFGYDGKLHHDTHFFEYKAIQSAKSLPGYRAFVDYLDDKIFSTNTLIVETFCDNVEKLFEKGFTGALPIDSEVSKSVGTESSELEQEYKEFLSNKPYVELNTVEERFVFDLVYEFSMKKLKTTDDGKECKDALSTKLYKGKFVDDLLELRNVNPNYDGLLSENDEKSITDKNKWKVNPKYDGLLSENDEKSITDKNQLFVLHFEKFMVFAAQYVLFTDINIVNVFCDLLEPLKLEGYTGQKNEDIEKFNKMEDGHKFKEEASIYVGYLKRVKPEVYVLAGLKTPKSFLATFGLHKLGMIMY